MLLLPWQGLEPFIEVHLFQHPNTCNSCPLVRGMGQWWGVWDLGLTSVGMETCSRCYWSGKQPVTDVSPSNHDNTFLCLLRYGCVAVVDVFFVNEQEVKALKEES